MQCDHQHPEVPCRLPENEDEFLSKTWPPVPQPQPWCAHEVRRKLRNKLTPTLIYKASTSCRWFGVQKLEAGANRHGLSYEVWCEGGPQVLPWELQVAWGLTKAEMTTIFCVRTLLYNGPASLMCSHTSITNILDDLDWSGARAYKQGSFQSCYFYLKGLTFHQLVFLLL